VSLANWLGERCWGLNVAFPGLVAPEDHLRPEPSPGEPSSTAVRRIWTRLMLMHLLWYRVNAGTKSTAEVARREERNLRISPRWRTGESKTEDAAGPTSLRCTRAEEPSAWPSRGIFVTSTPKVPRPNEGFKHLTNWSPWQGARDELVVWIYLSDLWSVDCNIGICRDIPPPSQGIFGIVLGRFLSPSYIKEMKREHLLLPPTVELAVRVR
jgi:hypothetical protein